jgi:hypothetical protein
MEIGAGNRPEAVRESSSLLYRAEPLRRRVTRMPSGLRTPHHRRVRTGPPHRFVRTPGS